MGFYDQTDYHEPKKRSSSPIWTALIAAIIGGLIVLLLTPLLINKGIISFSPPSTPLSTNISGPTKVTTIKVNSDITQAVQKVAPAVVSVINYKKSEDFFNPQAIEKDSGSGIIFRKADGKALIVTNYHVIEGGSQFKVVIPSDNKNREVDAKLLGGDQLTDLAVLEIPDKYVTTVAEFGNSDALKAGEPAIAIGNPLDLGQSVTVGVISSPKRTIDVTGTMTTDVIQTDAAINPGNSGGPLVNIAGQVVGINRLKISESGVEGLGFAIPVNEARPIIESLIKYGRVYRPFMAVKLVDLSQLPSYVLDQLNLPNSVTAGVVIYQVQSGGPAAQAGLQPRDVIVALDGQAVGSSMDVRNYLYSHKKIGDTVTVTYYRNGQKQTTTVKLSEAPQDLGQ
jgi:serine protease Do